MNRCGDMPTRIAMKQKCQRDSPQPAKANHGGAGQNPSAGVVLESAPEEAFVYGKRRLQKRF
jgi:hypothetical protein